MTTRWAPAKKDTLRALATEILHNYSRGRAFVAVDGLPGAGQAAFADDLADALRELGRAAFRASVEDFVVPVDTGSSPDVGVADPAFAPELFRRVLIEPFRLGGSTGWVEAAYDREARRAVEPRWVTGPADALLLVDGAGLNEPELAGLWNYSVWVTADAHRGGLRARATSVVDVSDPEHPRRVFDDAC
jgi:uridine kinase